MIDFTSTDPNPTHFLSDRFNKRFIVPVYIKPKPEHQETPAVKYELELRRKRELKQRLKAEEVEEQDYEG